MLVSLRQARDFAHQRFKKSAASPTLRVRVAALGQNTARFGLIIPKKVLPHVVDRNKVKRRLKSILQQNLLRIRGADILIFPNAKSLKLTFGQLEGELISVLKRLNLWKH